MKLEKLKFDKMRFKKLYDEPNGRRPIREWRGPRDTAVDFFWWAMCWKEMAMLVAGAPVSVAKSFFRYRWMATYLTTPAFLDRATEGRRGAQLRMAHRQYNRVVKKTVELLLTTFRADENLNPGNEYAKKVVMFDQLVPCQIMAGFPNLICIPAQTLPVFFSSIVDQLVTMPYLDAAESFGVPADVCPLPSAEAGCALTDQYPSFGSCFVACNMPCDGSIMTSAYQDRHFGLPVYNLGVPVRYNEEAVQQYAVEELRGCIQFIEEQTGEIFNWDTFMEAIEVYNQQTRYELQKWDVNCSDYPQMTGETFWIYRMFYYHLSGGRDRGFVKTDAAVNRIMMRAYEKRTKSVKEMRHRCVEWSCPANFYANFSIWLENCWGITVLTSMETLVSDIIIDTSSQEAALADLAKSYQRTTMRKHTKGGYANVLDELWRVCEQFNADMVLMYDQISCKGMDGLNGMFDEQARQRGINLIWVPQDLMDPRTIPRREMRRHVNLYMQSVMKEEPLDERLLDFDDSENW